MEMQKYPKIVQFRNIVKEVKDSCKYHNEPLPTLKFKGTPKIHGTNAGVGVRDGQIWAQSRNNIIAVGNDNAGFAQFVEMQKDIFLEIAEEQYGNDIVIYGEWCGPNIQKGVAIAQIPNKIFVIFGVRIKGQLFDAPCNAFTVPDYLILNSFGIYFADQFQSYEIEIDFNNPEKSINKMAEITEAVEKECPVGSYFDISGIGEGVVWSTDWKDSKLMFKVKGEKHSISKVKTLAPVDPEVLESIEKFVEYAVTENRLEQGLQEIGLDQKTIGAFVGWVNKDIHTEEADVLEANGLTMKQVGSKCSYVARTWYMEKLNGTF